MFEDETALAEHMMMSNLPQFFARNPNSTHLAPLKLFSLRPQATEIRNQHATGLCTAFATIAAMELVLKQKTGREYDFSELTHWSNYHQYKTEVAVDSASRNFLPEEGAFKFVPAMNQLNENEIFQNYRPSTNFKPYVSARISKQKRLINQLDVISELASGHPVVLGAGVNSSFDSDLARRTGRLSREGSDTDGGHAMLIVDYKYDSEKNVGNYILKNSWGSSWGDGGFAYLPFDYCGNGRMQQYCTFIAVQDVQLNDVRPQDPIASEIGIWKKAQKIIDQSSFGIKAEKRVIDMIQSITYVFEGFESEIKFTRERSIEDGSLETDELIGDHPELSLSSFEYAVVKLKSGNELKIQQGLKLADVITPALTNWCSGTAQPDFCTLSPAPADWTETEGLGGAARPAVSGHKVTPEDFYVWTETRAYTLSDLKQNERIARNPMIATASAQPNSDVGGVKVSKKAWPLISKIEISLNDQASKSAEPLNNYNYIVSKLSDYRTAFTRVTVTLTNGQIIKLTEGAQSLEEFERFDQ